MILESLGYVAVPKICQDRPRPKCPRFMITIITNKVRTPTILSLNFEVKEAV